MTPETLFPYDRSIQPSFFDSGPPLTRRDDPETSVAAARSVGRGAETAIMDAFAVKDGWTADELCRRLNRLHGPTVISALARLHKAGVLTDSRLPHRLSSRGREQIVWRVSDGHGPERELRP